MTVDDADTNATVKSKAPATTVEISGTITLEGIYNNGGNKVDNYKMKNTDLVLQFTESENTVNATFTGVE